MENGKSTADKSSAEESIGDLKKKEGMTRKNGEDGGG